MHSVLDWPEEDERVLTFRCQEILGDEVATFRRALAHLELPGSAARPVSTTPAARPPPGEPGNPATSATPRAGSGAPFTPRVRERFNELYVPVLAAKVAETAPAQAHLTARRLQTQHDTFGCDGIVSDLHFHL